MIENEELRLAYDFVQYTNRHIFLTGKAGTGKTTFLHDLRKNSPKRMIVVAPTGVAAINAGGVTIHSFFQLPFGPLLPGRLENPAEIGKKNSFAYRFSKKKIDIIRSIDLVVIDEVSMVRADLLDGIDRVLKKYRNNNLPFGGVQMLMIGDLQQLPPVVKYDEWELLRDHYETMFFFSSQSFRKCNPVTIELKHIYRQREKQFIEILNAVRDRNLSHTILDALNQRYLPGFNPDDSEGYVTLTTHNATADRINKKALDQLNAPEVAFEAEVEGTFPEVAFPADKTLVLKEGARVMFIKNDRNFPKRYFNGKTGTVVSLDEETVHVTCPGEEEVIEVEREMWENLRYVLNKETKTIEETVIGSFYQFPLRLAWAITIHKSQGLTFDRVKIDARAAFAHGQVYVALSRCRTLNGLVLTSPVSEEGVIQDLNVASFNKRVDEQKPDQKVLQDSKTAFLLALMEELFSFRSLSYEFDRMIRIVTENKNIILGTLPGVIRSVYVEGIQPLQKIAMKFMEEIRDIAQQEQNFEKGDRFRDRIGKAAEYFLEKMDESIHNPLESSTHETDNQTVEAALHERAAKIREMLRVKKACLNSLKNGFDFSDYLNARAVALVREEKKKPEVKTVADKTTSDHPALLEELRKWRSSKAQYLGLPHYRIAATKVLVAISNALPNNYSDLKKVKGIGPKKLNQYGDEILSMVALYQSSNIQDPTSPP